MNFRVWFQLRVRALGFKFDVWAFQGLVFGFMGLVLKLGIENHCKGVGLDVNHVNTKV
jgi:hypothetical protein